MKETDATTTQAGLWIDHRRAVIVRVKDKTETTAHVESGVEDDEPYTGDARAGRPHTTREGEAEDTRQRHFEGRLRTYYDDVITHLRGAEAIVILGPGEAKGELKARLEHAGLGAHIVGVETADKLTDGQIVAKVRELLAPKG